VCANIVFNKTQTNTRAPFLKLYFIVTVNP